MRRMDRGPRPLLRAATQDRSPSLGLGATPPTELCFSPPPTPHQPAAFVPPATPKAMTASVLELMDGRQTRELVDAADLARVLGVDRECVHAGPAMCRPRSSTRVI